MKTAESVAWRVERRVSASVAFDGAQFAPAVAWRLRRSAIFSVRFVAAARRLAFTTSRSGSRRIACSRLRLTCQYTLMI
jgi:hypothetical protein